MNEVMKNVSNFIKEEETEPDPIKVLALFHSMILTQQNLLEATNDIARCFTLMTRDAMAQPEVIQRVGHVRVAVKAAHERLDAVLEQLKNPKSLTG